LFINIAVYGVREHSEKRELPADKKGKFYLLSVLHKSRNMKKRVDVPIFFDLTACKILSQNIYSLSISKIYFALIESIFYSTTACNSKEKKYCYHNSLNRLRIDERFFA